jgi:WD40 repeat protein
MNEKPRKAAPPALLLLLCLLHAAAQHVPAQASDALRLPIQAGHTNDILRVKWSPDDRLLASYSAGDGHVKVWDVREARLLWSARTGFVRRKDESTTLVGLAWSPDAGLLAAASVNGALMLWDVHAGRLRWVNRDAHADNATAVAFSPDGKFVVSAASPEGGGREVKVWDAASGQPVNSAGVAGVVAGGVSLAAGGTVHETDLNSDGSLSAEAGRWGDASVKIKEVKSGKTYRVLEGHPGIVRALAFSPSGSRLASGGGDRLVRLWDAKSGTLLAALAGHARQVKAVAFSPDGRLLASSGQDRTLRLWDAQSGAPLRTVRVEEGGIWSYEAVAFSPDGRLLAAAGGNGFVRIFDAGALTTRQILQADDPDVRPSKVSDDDALSVAFSHDGARVLTGHESGAVKVWDARSGALLRVINTKAGESRAAFTPDDGRIVAVSGEDFPVTLWDARSGALVRKFDKGDGGYNHALAVGPDGTRLVTSDIGGDVILWDVRSGKALRKFDGGFSEDDAVAFSPDGHTLAAGGLNQNIIMWDAAGGAPLWALRPLKEVEDPLARDTAPSFAELQAERERKTRDADRETAAWAGKVSIIFDHFGELADPWQARMAETGEPSKSLKREPGQAARGVWLRLRNDSPLPISFRTYSMYLGGKCGAGEGVRRFGVLCEGMEVDVSYVIEDAKGKGRAPNMIDVFSTSTLPPGTSVLFSVPREHLAKGLSIYLAYTFLKEDESHKPEDYGSSRRAYFKSSDLKRAKAVTSGR